MLVLFVVAAVIASAIAALPWCRERSARPAVLGMSREDWHGTARDEELARWNRGHRSGARLKFAEGNGYVLGSGVDREWVEGLMASDDRIRRWNGQRPRRPALCVRID